MEIDIYESEGGRCPIRKKLQGINDWDKKKIFKTIEKLRTDDFKNLLRSEIVKQLENNLYELRPYNYRITFTKEGDCCTLLTLFKKQGDRMPPKELEKARRLKQLIS